jgi:nucleoid-associated protein YgaU
MPSDIAEVPRAPVSPGAVSRNLMSSRRLSSRGYARPIGLCAAVLFCVSISFLASPSRAQQEDQQDDQQVAEAARQEKARKAAQQKKDAHVYTNDDLKQSKILTEQDRARVEARKTQPAAQPGQPAEPAVDAEKDSPTESLGEVARRYRHEKFERALEAQRAAHPSPASRFPMDLAQPSLAVPVQPTAPLNPSISRPRQIAKPLAHLAPSKRDPFSRQFISPAVPKSTPGRLPILSAPAKPVPSFTSVAPRSPAVHTTIPPAAPSLLLPREPISVPPAVAPRAMPVTSPGNKISGSTIRVQPGDSLWKLARVHLGKGSRWNELLASNPTISDPSRLLPGYQLIVPTTNLRARVQSPTSVTVHTGDSLWKLAAAHFGTGTAWTCIAQANPQLRDPNLLRPGGALTLPTSCAIPLIQP